MFVPAPLFPGARVALVGPSSAVSEERLRRADAFVSALGLKPVYYPSCLYQSRDGYLAATDAQRAQDIMHAFEKRVPERYQIPVLSQSEEDIFNS